MGNAQCIKCDNCINSFRQKNSQDNSDILNNDSYISFKEEKNKVKVEENNISNNSYNNLNKIISIPKPTEIDKNYLENTNNIKNDNIEDLNKINNESSEQNQNGNLNKSLKIENGRIEKKDNPSSSLKGSGNENKTRNIVNELLNISNNNSINSNNKNGIHDSNNCTNKIDNESEDNNNKKFINNGNNIDNINNQNNSTIKNNNINKNNEENKENKNKSNKNKEIDIYNLIPKNKLLQLQDDSILCHGYFEKIIKIPKKNKIIYNDRFCILTKTTFAYYKSKENYLNLWKPLFSINIKNIKKVEQADLDDKTYYFGLICAINDETREYINKINTFENTNDFNKDEFLIGFRSKNIELIIQWILILNYLIENNENKE